MSHLQSIIEKCHLANPKLLELSFGCRLQYGALPVIINYSRPTLDWPTYKYMTDGGQVFYDSDDRMKNWCLSRRGDNWEVEWWKILWHPITLQDILLAMWPWYSITCWGLFFMAIPWDWYERFDKLKITNIRYDMSKSPYDQSEEVLEFISKNI